MRYFDFGEITIKKPNPLYRFGFCYALLHQRYSAVIPVLHAVIQGYTVILKLYKIVQ